MNYKLTPDNIYIPSIPIFHRDEEYDPADFELLCNMQEDHFWYKGRHRFLLAALDKYLAKSEKELSAIDLGGGVGGWISYLNKNRPRKFSQLALADSSLSALRLAESILPIAVQRYQVDLMDLNMCEQWDAAFLLDVIEHIPNDLQVVREVYKALKPGGYLFITAPAFEGFWSYNDEIVNHLRRYRKKDFINLAQQSGFMVCDSRYFMFFLSPLYLLSRISFNSSSMTPNKQKELMVKQHQVPIAPINKVLSAIFSLETPIGQLLQFPWGTSILGVFKKI